MTLKNFVAMTFAGTTLATLLLAACGDPANESAECLVYKEVYDGRACVETPQNPTDTVCEGIACDCTSKSVVQGANAICDGGKGCLTSVDCEKVCADGSDESWLGTCGH